MDLITAVDYLESQRELEHEARALMPFDPTECTYNMGELRQPVYACLTCAGDQSKDGFAAIGVCYSCSIQCHAEHDLVELFSKRSFTCDCGTTRMSNVPSGGCRLRQGGSRRPSANKRAPPLPVLRAGLGTGSEPSSRRNSLEGNLSTSADDIPSLGNSYNQNFKGLFCSCSEPYNPLDESRVMIQCHFGFACGEDWYHEDCIMGIRPLKMPRKQLVNLLNELSAPLEDAQTELIKKEDQNEGKDQNKDTHKSTPFPDLDDFDLFICWKCVDVFPAIFEELTANSAIVFKKLPHRQVNSLDEWKKMDGSDDGPPAKKVKSSNHFSVFFANGFQAPTKQLRESLENNKAETSVVSKVALLEFLKNYEYLYMDDPVYEPPADEDEERSSLLDLGAEALHSLPREQAIEGLQVYDKIRSKLRDFFKPFAEQGKVVTEDEVRGFFEKMKKSDEER